MLEAFHKNHFKTVSSNINILAGTAYWSTIKTLPATLPEPRAKDRGASFRHHGPRFGGRGPWNSDLGPRIGVTWGFLKDGLYPSMGHPLNAGAWF